MRTRQLSALFLLSLSPAAFAAAPAAPPEQASILPARSEAGPRHAAQRGLEWLSRSAQQWTKQNQCFGCHVQAVTLEGLTVGKHNHYDIAPADIAAMVAALQRGVTAGGHTTGTAFQGAAWARYDQWVDAQQTASLLKYARELIGLQQGDGSVADDDTRKPVIAGTMQTTFQAMQTWRQAYARTADEVFLPPMRRAERYISATAASWPKDGEVYLQDVNYALLGLVAAGVGSGEDARVSLQRRILSGQNRDGGWGLAAGESDAIATGQSLYALKMAGLADQDRAVSRGMSWLVEQQKSDGSWHQDSNQGGADKGATMWAVLGLVTVDVVSVAVSGVVDGQHVTPNMPLQIEARDNQGKGISQVEVTIDDLPLTRASTATLKYTWDTAKLSEGKHVLAVVATGAKGQKAERRFEVYAGNVFLTQLGARFDEGRQSTEVSLRDISPTPGGKVALEVYSVDEAKGEPKQGKRVFTTEQPSAPGGITFAWDGKGQDGKAQPKGRYYAQVVYRDAKGAPVQTEKTLFFQDREEVQRTKFAEVEGQLSLHAGAGQAANAEVDLVDAQGRVVQSTRTTEQGNYRFKNVDKGEYTIRAHKEGFKDLSSTVEAAPAQPAAKASMSW